MQRKILYAAMSLAVLSMTSQAVAAGNDTVPDFITARGAEVVKVDAAPGGMTAYTVKKDGRHAVFFTSADKSVTMLGVMFDSKDGRNLSDKFLPADQQPAAPATLAMPTPMTQPSPAIPAPSDAGKSHEAMQHIRAIQADGSGHALSKRLASSDVAGVVEGKIAKNTSYVFFDPDCSYCHTLYFKTRDAVKAGKSIKWIPVNTLGDPGVPKSIQVLKGGSNALESMAKNTLAGGATPSSAERMKIDQNTALMYMVVQNMGVPVATPTILFLNEKSGKLVIAQNDGTDESLLKAAFGAKAK